jgi:hypothetical protein
MVSTASGPGPTPCGCCALNAALICAGSDGHGAARQIDRIATGWRLKSIAKPLIVLTGAQTPEAISAPKQIAPAELARAAELGGLLAAGTLLGVW